MNKLSKLLHNPAIGQMIRFCITGGLNTVLDYVVYTVIAVVIGGNIYLAQFCGYSAGIICSYTINRSWTFSSGEKYFSKQMIRFLALNLVMLLVSMALIALFVDYLALGKLIGKLLTTCVTMVISFCVNRFWVFRTKRS